MATQGLTRILGITLLLVAITLVMSVLKPVFVAELNLSNLLRWTALLGILSVGVAFVIITGGIDLSIGSVVALTGMVLMHLLQEPAMNPWLAVAITLSVGVAIGALHGVLIGYCKLQPFIVTLCGLMAYRGLARLISGDLTLSLGTGYEKLKSLATGNPIDVPVPFIRWISEGNRTYTLWNPLGENLTATGWSTTAMRDGSDLPLWGWVQVPMPMLILLVLAVLSAVLLHKTVAGRYLLAMGRNEEAARFSGIDTRKMTVLAYVLCSTMAALGGVLFALYLSTVQPSSMGNFYELYAIAAAVLGGCSLRGGAGSIAGVIIGTAVMRSLYNAINLLGLAAYWEYIIIGGVLLVGVMVDEIGRQVVAKIKTNRRKKMLSG